MSPCFILGFIRVDPRDPRDPQFNSPLRLALLMKVARPATPACGAVARFTARRKQGHAFKNLVAAAFHS